MIPTRKPTIFESMNRIRSMALVHERLTQGEQSWKIHLV